MNTFSTLQWSTGHSVDFSHVNGAARQVLKWHDDQFVLGEPARITSVESNEEDNRAGLTCVRPIFAKVSGRFAGVVLEYGENTFMNASANSSCEASNETDNRGQPSIAPRHEQPIEHRQNVVEDLDPAWMKDFFKSLQLPAMLGKPTGISDEVYWSVARGWASDEKVKSVFEAWYREMKISGADLEESWKMVQTRYDQAVRRPA